MVFKPGQSGNPGGRPKNRFVSDALKELAKEKGKELALVMWKTAIDGDVNAMKAVLDRVEGKVVERVEVEGDADLKEAILEAMNPFVYRNGRSCSPENGDSREV